MNIEMKYFNVYYYCNIVSNMIKYQTEEFLVNLSEFSHAYIESIPETYQKESMLIHFCKWAAGNIMEEDMYDDIKQLIEKIEKIKSQYQENIGEDEDIDDLHKFFNLKKENKKYHKLLNKYRQAEKQYIIKAIWSEGYEYTLQIDKALEFYFGDKPQFTEWLLESNEELIEDTLYEYLGELKLTGWYEAIMEKIAHEMFYILFLNREFLLKFNVYMARTHNNVFAHVYTPRWVERAVFHRDRGKCCFCNKDLTSVYSVMEERGIQYDHIVSLECGGINDVSNLQLLCDKCNLSKGSSVKTNNIYQNWFHISDGE